MSNKPTYPVGVSVLITDDHGRILLGERVNVNAAGLLSTPGGRIEYDEDIIATAVRETFEETGLTVAPQDLTVIGWREHKRFGEHYFMFYVQAAGWSGDIKNKEPDKCKGWTWHAISDLRFDETTEPLDVLAMLWRQPVQP